MKKSLIASSLLSMSLFSTIAYPRPANDSTPAPQEAIANKAPLTASEIEAVLDGVWSVDPRNIGETNKTTTFVIRSTPSTFQFCPKHPAAPMFSVEEQGENKIFADLKNAAASMMIYNGDLMFTWLMFDEAQNFSKPIQIVGFEDIRIEGSYVMGLKRVNNQWVLELDGDNKDECGKGVPCLILTKVSENTAVKAQQEIKAQQEAI